MKPVIEVSGSTRAEAVEGTVRPESRPPIGLLSEAQIAQYRRDGILFPVRILDGKETAGFRKSFDTLLSLIGDGATPGQLAQCQLHFRWAYDLVTHPAILDVAGQIVGPDILVHSMSIFWKRPRDRTFVSWHQDGHYMKLSEPAFVSAWVALSESTPRNGCMRVVPGSHSGGRLPHGETALDSRNLLSSGLEIAVDVDESEATDVVLAPGEMSMHDLNIVHGSNPNDSDSWRIGCAIRYAAPHVTQQALHHRVIVARGEDRFHHFDALEEPPCGTLEEGLVRQREFVQWLTRLRQSQGRKG